MHVLDITRKEGRLVGCFKTCSWHRIIKVRKVQNSYVSTVGKECEGNPTRTMCTNVLVTHKGEGTSKRAAEGAM